MVIRKKENFKLKIEDLKYKRNEKGDVFFSEWTGYGPIIIPFGKTIFLKRGTRKPIFTMLYKKNRVLEIDVREYLLNHLNYLEDKESENIEKEDKITKSFDKFEKPQDNQLSLF